MWRQAQLTAKHGLYEVADGIYQVRGFDMSNMTLVESDHGVIVIDPLVSAERGRGPRPVPPHRGDRAVTAVIYTHAHLDHFGGVLGVVDADTESRPRAGALPGARGLRERLRGTAMTAASFYYAAVGLPKGPTGTLGMGLGPGVSAGPIGLIARTLDITTTGQEEVLDGVRIVFQLHARHRVARRRSTSTSRQAGPVHGRERHAQHA